MTFIPKTVSISERIIKETAKRELSLLSTIQFIVPMNQVVIISEESGLVEKLNDSIGKIIEISLTRISDLRKVEKVFSTNKPELIIADISGNQLQNLSNILIKNKINCPTILLDDPSSNTSIEDLRKVKPYLYLVRPFHINSIVSGCISILDKTYIKKKSKDQFTIKTKGKLVTLNVNDIHYIISSGNNCKVYLKTRVHEIRYPLGKLLDDLNVSYIIRSHRKYLLNLNKVTRMDIMDNIVYVEDVALPVGRLFKKNLKSKLQKASI